MQRHWETTMTSYIIQLIVGNRIRAFKTCALMLSFVGLGLYESALGPSLLDLKLVVNGSMYDIAWIMPAGMVGYVIGSFLIGFVLYPYINPFLCEVFSLLSSAVLTAFLAYNKTLAGMLLTLMANGIALGIIDGIGHLTILFIWGNQCDPFMQLLHFAFGLGGILGPLIVSPFLLPSDGSQRNSSNFATVENTSENVQIQTAYLIISSYMICLSTLFFYIFVYHRHTLEHPSRMAPLNLDSKAVRINKIIHKTVIALATAFIHIYYGIEIAMATFLTTFAYFSDLHLSKEIGAIITSVYWSTFTLMQLGSVFYIHIIGPEKNIICLLGIILVANCFLIPFGNTNVWCLWIGTALLGMGMSCIWGSMFGYLENYFPVTNKIAAGLTIFACFGELVIPNLISLFIVETPMVFLWIICFCSLAICVLFCVINLLLKMFLVEF